MTNYPTKSKNSPSLGQQHLDIAKIQWLDVSYVRSQLNPKPGDPPHQQGILDHILSHDEQVELAEDLISKAILPEAIKLNRWFDVDRYLKLRPDVKLGGINPSLHYFVTGHKEPGEMAINASPSIAVVKKRIEEDLAKIAPSPSATRKAWRAKDLVKLSNSSDIAEHINKATSGNQSCILSISHDDPYKNSGGIQKIIREETEIAASLGIGYIHVSPFSPHPCIEDLCDGGPSICRIHHNGEHIGELLQSSLFALIKKIKHIDLTVSIHHFFGFNAASLSLAISALAYDGNILYWVHDYSSCCLSYTLLMDGLEYCGGPHLTSTKCKYCHQGETRANYIEKITPLFKGRNRKIIFPSKSASDTLNKSISAISQATKQEIHPHIQITHHQIRHKDPKELQRKLKIAYIGTPARHKGFDEFRILSQDPMMAAHFDWVHIGKGDAGATIDTIYCDGLSETGAEQLVRENNIDIAFIWPLWPETFCFTAYEALCAGCHILTNNSSGNVVNGLPSPYVSSFHSIDEARKWLLNDIAHRQSCISYASDVTLKHSRFTLDFLQGPS